MSTPPAPASRRRRLGARLPALLFLALTAACGPADDGPPPGAGLDTSAALEVHDATGASLGSVVFPVSCSPEAAAEMRHGLALLHNMTYSEAASAFQRAADADPTCGMANWGIAMTYVHPLWPDVPTADQLDRGMALLEEAREKGLPTAREQGYVAALEAYYRDGANRSEQARLASFAEGWAEVRADHPGDPEAALFAALSSVATASAAADPLQAQRAAGLMAREVLASIPDHPGAHHYVIHAFDAPPLAEMALPVARSYGEVAPANAHALHMTSHIFTRRGLWVESIDFNERSADAAWDAPIGGRVSHHYLHAVDYLVYAHLQRGADAEAQAILAELRGIDQPSVDNAASAYAFAAVPARLALERGDWAAARRVQARWPSTISWDAFPHLEAIPVFAMALGSARSGDVPAARRAADRLDALHVAAADVADAYDWATQVEVQAKGVRGWIAHAGGRTEEAVDLMSEAAALEATTQKNPVTPGEVLPAGELLGDMLLELGRYEEAYRAYGQALERTPNRFNSLYGQGRTAEAMGDAERASEAYGKLLEVAGSSTTRGDKLERARGYMEG